MEKKTIGGISIDLSSEAWRIAVHEAAHAAVLLHYGVEFDRAEILDIPTEVGEGVTRHGFVMTPDEKYPSNPNQVFDIVAAGPVAEYIFLPGERIVFDHSDHKRIRSLFGDNFARPDNVDFAAMLRGVTLLVNSLIDNVIAIAAGLYKYAALTLSDAMDLIEETNQTLAEAKL